MMRALITVASTLALVACASAEKPYHFVTPHAKDAIDVVARTLAAQGQVPLTIDPKTGIVVTHWEDTGFHYGYIGHHQTATLIRRYTVTLARGEHGDAVSVRQDTRRCAVNDYSISGPHVWGTCETMERIVDSQNAELRALGKKLEAALAHPHSP